MPDEFDTPRNIPDAPSRAHNEILSGDCRKICDIVSRLGDKWSMRALLMLRNGPMRFGELRAGISGISQRMLTITLRSLERDGLLTRVAFAVIPPKVEYALTPMAYSLVEALSHLDRWVSDHYQCVTDARALYDEESERSGHATRKA